MLTVTRAGRFVLFYEALLCSSVHLYRNGTRGAHTLENHGQCLLQTTFARTTSGQTRRLVSADEDQTDADDDQPEMIEDDVSNRAWQELKSHLNIFDKREPWKKQRERAKKVLYEWVIALRSFMVFLAWTCISSGFVITMNNIRNHWRLPRLQTATAQLIMALAVLAIFPSLTSYSKNRIVWIMALRYLTEGYATLLAMYGIPRIVGEYINKALKQENQRKRGQSTLHIEGPLSVAAKKEAVGGRSHTEMRPLPKIIETKHTPTTKLHTSQGQIFRPRKMATLHDPPFSLIFLLCYARPGLCICRGLISRIIAGVTGSEEELYEIKVMFNILNLAILLGSLGLGWYKVRSFIHDLTEYLPMGNFGMPMTVGILPLIGNCQDLGVAWLYGAEGLAISFAGLLYLHEVVVIFLTVAWHSRADHQILVQLRGLEEIENPPSYSTWLLPLLDLRKAFYNSEYWDTDGEDKALKAASKLCCLVLADTHMNFVKDTGQDNYIICAPYQLTHHEERWKQQGRLKTVSSWRAVLMDSFTSRVHSPLLTVSFLAIVLDRAMELIGPVATWTNDLGFVYAGGLVLVIIELSWTCLGWLAGGCVLLGNNVFMHRRWLVIALLFFFLNTHVRFRRFFLPPEVLARDFSLLWRNFFQGCIALIGFISTLRAITSSNISSYFMQVETTALRYTHSLVSNKQLFARSKFAKELKAIRKVNSMSLLYPPILIASALASLPMVMATSYYVVFSVNGMLHSAQELQVSMELINENVQNSSGGVSLLMATFDKDLDGKLSRTELEGLFRGLEAIGLREVGEQVFFLADAAGDRDGLLSVNEVDKFVVIMKQVAYAAQIIAGDGAPEGKSEKLLGIVGDKCVTPEKATQILGTAQMVMSPGTPPLIPDAQLRQAVRDADVDHNDCLSAREFSQYLGNLRAELEAKKAQVQALLGTLSNPSPENLQQLAGQLSSLDLDKNGLDLSAGSPQAQPLVGALTLISPDAAAAVPQLLRASDTNMDGLLSTAGVPPLKAMVPGGVPAGGIPNDPAAAISAAKSAAAAKALDSISGKMAQDAQQAAVLAANLQREMLAMKAAKMAMTPAGGMPSASGTRPTLSLLQDETFVNSFANEDVPMNSAARNSMTTTTTTTTTTATKTAARNSSKSSEWPEQSLLQMMPGVAVQPETCPPTEQTIALQRMVNDNARIAIMALEQIASGEMFAQDAAAAALEKIRSHSANFLQHQNVKTSTNKPELQELPKMPHAEQPKSPKVPLTSQAPKVPQANAGHEANGISESEGMSENAEVLVFIRHLAPYLHKAAEAANALLTSLADDENTAHVILQNFDNNKDRFITKDELANAIGPAVAPLYPLVSARQLASAVILPGLVDTDRDGRLEESELERVAQILSMCVVTAYGDVNGDGSKDSKDLLAAAKQFGSLGASQHEGANHQAKGVSLLSLGAEKRTSIKKASLVTVAVRQRLGEVATPDGEIFPAWFSDYVAKIDDALSILPVPRLKMCLLVSGALAFAFSIYILYTAFRGYHWMFVQMQTGSHEYPGNSEKKLQKELRNQYGNSTLFLGMLMSTMVCGWLLAFGLIFFVLSVLMLAQLWITLWQLKVFLLFLVMTKLIIILLRSVVIDQVLNEDGWITWPITFSCVYVILMILNFAIGLLASVCRFFLLVPAMLYRFNTLDDTMVPEFMVTSDPGYYCLLCLTYTSYEQMNPICRSFITSLSKTAHRLYGPSFKTSDEVRNWDEKQDSSSHTSSEHAVEPASVEVVKRAQRRRILRNKLWLAILLEQNPSLQSHRHRDIINRQLSHRLSTVKER